MGRLEIYAMIKIGEVWECGEGDDFGKAIRSVSIPLIHVTRKPIPISDIKITEANANKM